MIKETLQIFDIDRNPRRNVSYEKIDKVIGVYNPKDEHQAPLTIGHAEHDTPAQGWVGKIFRMGRKVFANVSYIPEFAKRLIKGEFKFVSIALKPNYELKSKEKTPYLRHLAFTPVPAIPGMKVTGLAPATFSDGLNDYETLEDYEFSIKEEIKKKENYMEKEQVDILVNAAVDQALKKREDELKTEFSDKIEKTEENNKKLQADIDKKTKEITKLSKDSEEYAGKEVENKINLFVDTGRMDPAEKDGWMEKYLKFKEKGAIELFYEELDKIGEKEVKLESGSHFKKKKDPNKKLKEGDMDPEEAKFHEQLGNSKEDIEEYADMDEFSIAYVSPRAKGKEG